MWNQIGPVCFYLEFYQVPPREPALDEGRPARPWEVAVEDIART